MQTKVIFLILFVFLTGTVSAALADRPAYNAREEVSVTGPLSDEALASYINGRLGAVLKTDSDAAGEYCDQTGCAVVVQ